MESGFEKFGEGKNPETQVSVISVEGATPD
jgi:hypothetical protein